MDLFSVIWLLVVVGFMVVPAVIDKRLKNAGGRGQGHPGGSQNVPRSAGQSKWPTPAAWPQKGPQPQRYTGTRPAAREEFELPAITDIPIAQESPITAETIAEGESGLGNKLQKAVGEQNQHKKFIVNPKDMVIYSTIMNPKFEES